LFYRIEYAMREDEGRKLMKPQMIEKILRVRKVVGGSTWVTDVNSLLQKVRYKKYVLTKRDMRFLNNLYSVFTREME